MRAIVRLLLSTVGVIVAAYLLPGIDVDGMLTAIVIAVVLALLNYFVRPLLILLTIPLTIFTLGLFLLVINSLIVLLADYLIDGFEVSGFWSALSFSLLLSIINSMLIGSEKPDQK